MRLRAAGALGLVVAVTAGAGAATAGMWSGAGGDAGRSGFQPVSEGGAPWSQMWDIPDRDVKTSVVIGSAGGPGRSPRVIYGTGDGAIHVRDLYTGEPIGAENGVNVTAHRNADVFSGYNGSVAPVIADGPSNSYGQAYVVYNDRFGPTEPNPQRVTDEIAIAQIDESNGKLVQRRVVPGSAKFVVSGPPFLSPPDESGTRQLIFIATTDGEYDSDVNRSAPKGTPTLFRVPLRNAGSAGATIDIGEVEKRAVAKGNPYAGPSLVMLDNVTAADREPQRPFVAYTSADPAGQVKTVRPDMLNREPGLGVAGIGQGPVVDGPSSGALDPGASATNATYANSVSVPVARTGDPPGTGASNVSRAPALVVSTYNPIANRTVVHKLAFSQDGASMVEVANSGPLPGKPGPQLALASMGINPGDPQGLVIVGTSSNLFALDGGDLSVRWKLDPADALAGGTTGFQRTIPAATDHTVFIARDNGEHLLLRLHDGKRFSDEAFDEFESNEGHAESRGAPAVSPTGVVVFGGDKGIFAYRARCANPVALGRTARFIRGTFAGDVLRGTAASETMAGEPGDDCLDSGGGNDIVDGGQGDDNILGGEGADRILGGDDDDVLSGNGGADRLDGQDGNDELHGWGDADVLKGGLGNDYLIGGAARDRLYGDSGADTLEGRSGDDRLSGGNGPDRLVGGSGVDELMGGNGNDTLFPGRGGGGKSSGGRGDDVIEARNGVSDEIDCGSGIDSIRIDTRKDRYKRCEYLITKRGRRALKRRR